MLHLCVHFFKSVVVVVVIVLFVFLLLWLETLWSLTYSLLRVISTLISSSHLSVSFWLLNFLAAVNHNMFSDPQRHHYYSSHTVLSSISHCSHPTDTPVTTTPLFSAIFAIDKYIDIQLWENRLRSREPLCCLFSLLWLKLCRCSCSEQHSRISISAGKTENWLQCVSVCSWICFHTDLTLWTVYWCRCHIHNVRQRHWSEIWIHKQHSRKQDGLEQSCQLQSGEFFLWLVSPPVNLLSPPNFCREAQTRCKRNKIKTPCTIRQSAKWSSAYQKQHNNEYGGKTTTVAPHTSVVVI